MGLPSTRQSVTADDEERLVVGEHPRGQLVQGEGVLLGGAPEDGVQLLGPGHLVGQQIPLRAARTCGQRTRRSGSGRVGARAAPAVGRPVRAVQTVRTVQTVRAVRAVPTVRTVQCVVVRSLAGGAGAELAEMFTQVVEVVSGEIAQGALPARCGVLGGFVVLTGAARTHGVDPAAQTVRLRDQRVQRRTLGRLRCWTVRIEGGRHRVSDTGCECSVTTVAQAVGGCR